VSPVTRRLTLLGSAWLAALALATLFVPSLLIPAVASAHDVTGGMMTMRMVEDLEIPAGGSVTLAPSGTHVMLMGLKAALQKGTTFPATLRFEKAGEVAVQVMVQGIADLAPAD